VPDSLPVKVSLVFNRLPLVSNHKFKWASNKRDKLNYRAWPEHKGLAISWLDLAGKLRQGQPKAKHLC
jgi:hypothetical protein